MEGYQYILIADYVPLANKGEEAIIRGIQDMLSDERPAKIGLFDNVKEVTFRDNITIFPRDWVFRSEGNMVLSPWHCKFLSVLISLQMRLGYYSRLRNLILSSTPKHEPLRDFFAQAEYVLVGHDGVFCTESCGIIHLAKKAGKCAGMLGTSGGIAGKGRVYKGWLYRRAMEESDFCVFRERYSYENMKRISRSPDKLILAPDPAFAMRPAEPAAAREVLERYANFRRARETGRKIVGATVLEKGRVYYHFMPEMDGTAKRQAHAKYLASIFDALIKERNAFVVFLPHSIEEDFSDVAAAWHVAEAMTSCVSDYMILEEDCEAWLLKSIIRECDFLVGERAHSLIGSVCVATPFLALTNRKDSRMHGILGDMCQCESQIVDMEVSDERTTRQKALDLFDDRESIRGCLEQIGGKLLDQLAEVSRIVKSSKAGRCP